MSPHSPRRAPSQYPQTQASGSPSGSGHQPSANRKGFTLIELMVVIVIISILVAFLLPAISRTRATARVAEVKVDISKLEAAITAFRTEFGIDPPSRITLYEAPDTGSSSPDPSWNQDSANPTRLVRSRTLVRRLWPQFDFSASTTTPVGSGWDINGDGDRTDTITLTGAECLLFFLGGMTSTNYVNANDTPAAVTPPAGTPVGEWVTLGFSKNPRNPFERSQGTRIGPFTEFNGGRMLNVEGPSDAEAMPEYLDPLPSQTMPYLYATSSDGKGYDPLDLAPTSMGPPNGNVYLQKDDDPSTIGDSSEVPWNQSGFQIISPGFDNLYGLGGLFDESKPFDVATFPMRIDERDNITNFASGMLEE